MAVRVLVLQLLRQLVIDNTNNNNNNNDNNNNDPLRYLINCVICFSITAQLAIDSEQISQLVT